MQKKQLFAVGVILFSVGILLIYAKILFLVMLICAASFWMSRNGNLMQKVGLTLLPLLCGLMFAWITADITYSIMSYVSEMRASVPPDAPHYSAWIGSKAPADKPDVVGRYALLIGSIIGFAATFWVRPRARHGYGVVAGKSVVEGGWAGLSDLADKCDFGMPKKGAGGIPLGRLQGKVVRLNPNKGKIKIAGHTLIIGATGTGKSYTCIRNMIIAAACDDHSIVVSDPKGELFESMGQWLKQEGYELIGFNVANPSRTHRWNPLAECRDYEEIMDLADWLIAAAGDDHSFFSGGEKNVFAAVAAYTRWVLPPEQQHLRSTLSLLSWPQEALDVAFKDAFLAGKIDQPVMETWKAAQGHFTNYVEGVRNKIRSLTKGGLAALTSSSDFSLDSVGRKKTALFLILPDEGDLKSLYMPFYAFLFRRLKQAAEVTGSGRLPVPVRFILDEFANIGKIPDIDKVCALGRSRGIMVQIALQNIGQLQGLYRKNNAWKAVVGNCPIKICLAVDDEESAKFFASIAGKARVRDITESRDVTTPWDALKLKRKESTKDINIIQPFEILQIPEDDCIVVLRGKKPVYLQKISWTDLPQYRAVKAAGQLRAEEFLPEIDMNVSLPLYPEGVEEKPKDKDRDRSKGQKIVKKEVIDDGEIDLEAAKKLGI